MNTPEDPDKTPFDEEWDDLDDESYEGECQACECWGPLDDLGLCADCSAKMERDLIRQRAWEYSAMAFGVPPEKHEALRAQIIQQYGAAYELLAPPGDQPGRKKRKR